MIRTAIRAARKTAPEESFGTDLLEGDLLQEDLLEGLGRAPPAPSSLFLDYVGSLLSLGLAPAALAELRLLAHLQRDQTLDRACKGEGFATLDGLGSTARHARLRLLLTCVCFGFSALLALLGALLTGSSSSQPAGVALLVLAGTNWVLTVVAQLALHHRALRRHDASQLALHVREGGVVPGETERLVVRHEDAWARCAAGLTRATWFAALLSTLCFPFAYVTFPLWLARAFQVPLELHRRRVRLGNLD